MGLGPDWTCLLANDIDAKKMQSYQDNFGVTGTKCCDIAKLKTREMPGQPDLAWASFPCQDLSLAGNRLGLGGERSSAFWGFWSAINKLKLDGRPPPVLVLENVCGLLTSHNGKDFSDLCRAMSSLGYFFGAVVADAVRFLPQSRPRLFVICVRDRSKLSQRLCADGPTAWHNIALQSAVTGMPQDLKSKWIWWKLPEPQSAPQSLADLLEDDAVHHRWNSEMETSRLLKMMSSLNLDKVMEAKSRGKRTVGTIYKRTRIDNGKRLQRAEVRFDGIAGCLRTPGGGSSRQSIIVVEQNTVRSRLLSIREAARLMGVHDDYILPHSYNDGYHIFGDGLAVPVVSHIARNLLLPILDAVKSPRKTQRKLAA